MTARRAVPAITAALVLLAVAPVAGAHTGDRNGHRADFVPVHRLAGSSGEELLAQWWETVLPIPAAQNPIVSGNAGLCFQIGRRHRVATYATVNESLTCTIAAGEPLFIVTYGFECSSAEPPPFFGATEAEQRDCVSGFFADPAVLAIRLSLDGGQFQDVHNERFQTTSRQGSAVFPESPIFDATPGPATFVAGDWPATLRRDLRPGQHTITVEVQLADETFSTVLTLNVVRRHHDHH